MKKQKKIKGVIYSATPPPGWPTEEQFALLKSRMVEKSVIEAEPLLKATTSATDRIKHELCKEFYRCFEDSEMMQKDFAKKLKITESRVSEILAYRYESYTIDKLLSILLMLKPDLRLKVA